MKPELVFGTFIIPTFFIVIIFTILLIIFLIQQKIKKLNLYNKSEFIFNLTTICLIFAFLGARFFHVLFEEPHYYYYFWPEIFKFWKGGFVFYGGFLTSLIFGLYYTFKSNENIKYWLDFFTPFISLGYAIGRFGCFLEGCCYGKTTDFFIQINHLHPTQLYMMFFEFVTYILISQKFKKVSLKNTKGNIFWTWLLLHGLFRFIIEFLRDDKRGQFYFDLSISQIVSLIFILISVRFLYLKQTTEQ